MDLGLHDRVVAVGGDVDGPAVDIARSFLDEGAAVILACPEADTGAFSARIDIPGTDRLDVVALDVNGPDSANLVDRAVDLHGRVDVVVLVAPTQPDAPIDAIDDPGVLIAAWESVVAAVRIYQQAAPHMRSQGWGRFVHVCTSGVKTIAAGESDLEVIDGLAMLALHKVVANELGPYNVTANTVVWAPITSPADMSAAVSFLASDQAGFLSGVAITADAGAGASVF